MSIPSGMNSSTVRPKASTSRTVLEAMSATGAGVKSITVMTVSYTHLTLPTTSRV